MIDRRTLMQTVPAAMVAPAALADKHEPLDYNAATARMNFFASVIGRDAPSRLLSDGGAPSPELLTFCRETGMSLDWVFLGDLTPMVLASYRDNQNDTKAETPIQSLYPEWEELGNRYGNAIDENNAYAERLSTEGNPEAHRLSSDHYERCVEPLCDEFQALEDKMMEIPAQDLKDMAIKARISARVDGLVDNWANQIIRADADRLLGCVNV